MFNRKNKQKEIDLLKEEINLLREMLEYAFYDGDEREHYDFYDWIDYLRKGVLHDRFIRENERLLAESVRLFMKTVR